MTIQSLLDGITPLPHVRGASVLDLATGVCMGSGGSEAMEAERLARDYARSLNTIRIHLEPLADEDRVQEMRFTLPDSQVLITPISSGEDSGLYLCLLLEGTARRDEILSAPLEQLRDAFNQGSGLLDEDHADALYNYRV
jgi:hypothetical protein